MMAELKSESQILKRIFEYNNYRHFLKDYFEDQKKVSKVFSHRFFAKKAGFSSSSFCAHVIENKRNLTLESMWKIIKALNLKNKEAQFFETLVLYNQAKTAEEMQLHFENLDKIRKSTRFYKVSQSQWAYFDEWYLPAIRELAVYAKWNGDFKKLGSLLNPPLPAEKVKKGLETLIELGFLSLSESGDYVQANPVITNEGVPGYIVRKSRQELMLKAIQACENMHRDERHISACMASMSEKSYQKICGMIDELRRKILEEAVQDDKVEKVYQFNFQIFPLTQKI